MKSDSLQYVSTRGHKKKLEFHDVIFEGLAPDGGLYIPEYWPTLNKDIINSFSSKNYTEIAHDVLSPFLDNTINENELRLIIESAYRCFDSDEITPLTKISNDEYLLELHHGPTYAFKDIAMQFIARLMDFYLSRDNTTINILGATSGDTGAAAISAIKNRKKMKIFVLHPHNKISKVQRKFMTTVDSENVFNIALEGNFDDCQKLVKLMFNDKKFSSSINMSGVNSINWSRIVFQIVYYFYSYFKIAKENEKINFSVPTGNFGDIYAGYIAKKMGLPIDKLIIATNKNDILKRVINTGIYKPLKTEHTLSPSMDIQVASNFERLIFDIINNDSERTIKLMHELKEKGEFKLSNEEIKKIRNDFFAESLSDIETRSIIKKFYDNEKILIDPHTAVGIGVIEKIKIKGTKVVLATAHPSKFSDVVMDSVGIKPELPNSLKNTLDKKEKYEVISNNLKDIKDYIGKKI